MKISKKKLAYVIAISLLLSAPVIASTVYNFAFTTGTITILAPITVQSVSTSYNTPLSFGSTGNPNGFTLCTQVGSTNQWTCPAYPSSSAWGDFFTLFFNVKFVNAQHLLALNYTTSPHVAPTFLSQTDQYTAGLVSGSTCSSTVSSTNSNPTLTSGFATVSSVNTCFDQFTTFTVQSGIVIPPTSLTINLQ